jgi:hypothetical protein
MQNIEYFNDLSSNSSITRLINAQIALDVDLNMFNSSQLSIAEVKKNVKNFKIYFRDLAFLVSS